ncbi:MAG: helix-turn-helix domain-containing protein [Ruminococcaceae bacterium]|nr:helix-turn-helix domain-containing protein [Oscillospiraceae bacterium]
MEKLLFQGKIPDLSVEQILRDGSFNMTRQHFHSSYEIYYLLEGERNYFIKSKAYRVGRGNLVFIGCGQIHKTTVAHSDRHERILLEVSESLIHRLVQDPEGETLEHGPFSSRSGVLELTGTEQEWVEAALFRMIEEIREKQPAYVQAATAVLQQLLIFIMRKDRSAESKSPAIHSAKHQKVNEVANYIGMNYSDIPSLDALSERFYISKYYLCRIFKEVTGMTISQYINANRLKAAEKMLLESSESIIRIAALSGFGNVTYFDKVFRESLGLSPAQYRKFNRNLSGQQF